MFRNKDMFGSNPEPGFHYQEIPVLSPGATQALVLTELSIQWAATKGVIGSTSLLEARDEVVKIYNGLLPKTEDETE